MPALPTGSFPSLTSSSQRDNLKGSVLVPGRPATGKNPVLQSDDVDLSHGTLDAIQSSRGEEEFCLEW